MAGLIDGIEITPAFAARFQLGELLGAGAVGTVRAATHREMRRPVAIKFLRRLGDPQFTERFLREARALARVQHPNVLKVFELGEVSGHPFLVTALVPGGTLRQRVQREPRLSVGESLRLVMACLDGLAACHDAGFVHRDMKPENVLLEADGTPIIADLGIARCMELHSTLTVPGTVMGTPRYMSPEQARGEKVGPPTDLYAVGVILFELLTGRAPFNHADVGELMKMQIRDAAPDLPPGDWPAGLPELVASALAKPVDARPQSASRFALALKRVLEPRRRTMRVEVPEEVPEKQPEEVPVEIVTGSTRGLYPPRPETRPLMIAACLAASAMTFLAFEPWRPTRVPKAAGSVAAAVAPALEPASLALRLSALQKCRARAEERQTVLRNALEEDHGGATLPGFRAALAEAEEDLRLTRELVRELDGAKVGSAPGEPLAVEMTRALALEWLATARRCWFRQKIDLLTRRKEDWTQLAATGPEAASTAIVPVLKRWLTTAEAHLKRTAMMPSMAGPDLADLLDEVHAVALATHVIDWHPTAQPQMDQAEKGFLAGVGHLSGIAAPLLEKIVGDLWRWGHAEGETFGYASGVIFEEHRGQTVEHLGSLGAFLSAPAREALQRLTARAANDFRPSAR